MDLGVMQEAGNEKASWKARIAIRGTAPTLVRGVEIERGLEFCF